MDSDGLSQVVTALETIHSSSSTNEKRHEAQTFLDFVKYNDDSPLYGWQLSHPSNGNAAIVKHFGLTLLEDAIKYKFASYDDSKKNTLRDWVVDLAQNVGEFDPHYIKEKISFLWAATAKRIWGFQPDNYKNSTDVTGEWVNMDSELLKMWNTNSVSRELTLSIYRTLFEDIYILDDGMEESERSSILKTQCMEVVTSDEILREMYVRPDYLASLRSDPDGWLKRWSDLLGECLNTGLSPGNQAELFSIKCLEVLKTCLYWISPTSIRKSNILERLSVGLTLNNVKVRTLCTDCLHILFTRPFSNDEDFQSVVGAVFQSGGISTLAQVYNSIVDIDLDDFDELQYVLLKKIVEMIVGLGEYLNLNKSRLSDNADTATYLRLVLETTKHPSLMVSGLSLQFWCSVLRVEQLASSDEVTNLLPLLLETAAERCIKYESVGEDHPSRRYLDIDFDTISEAQTFLGNYRRYIENIVRLVVCRVPVESLGYLRNRMEQFFNSELGWECLKSQKLNYEGNPAFYLAYSQFILVEAALKGVLRWKIWYTLPDKEEVSATIFSSVEEWGKQIISMNLSDPVLQRRMVQCLVQFAPLLKNSVQIMFVLLEKVLTACTTAYPENCSDEDMELVRDLRTSCGTELNRLAYMIPSALMQIYDDLERVIADIIVSAKLSDHEVVSFKSFLLVVSQRANVPNKAERFSTIVDPVLASWTDEGTVKGLMDLPWFMERLGIVKIAEYFKSRGVTAETNLLETSMDEQGRVLKTELNDKWSALFPIRATRIFIQYTIEKLDHGSPEYRDLLSVWKPRIQPILPHILQLVTQIQAYHNSQNWNDLPKEVQSFVKYSCAERFWQVYLSTKTRDEFVDENVRAMHTLRDFADSVGHIVRYTREYAFLTLGSISQLEETLYEIPGMGSSLWQALAGDSAGITSHAWRHMISLTIRSVIKNCPIAYIDTFMKDFLPPMLIKLDEVLTEKWEKVYLSGLQLIGDEADEDFSEEMMDEHLLRQLTAIVDRMLIDLVGQASGNSQSNGSTSKTVRDASQEEALRECVLNNESILAPFLKLCSHIMQFKDNRCSYNCCLILKKVIPSIVLKSAEVDGFLCNEMMKACLNILNDPFFGDVQSEAGSLLVQIYSSLRAKYQEPMQILMGYLPPTVNSQDVEVFETRLLEAKSLRQQRGILLDFLAEVKVMESRDQFDPAAREAAIRKKNDSKQRPERKWLSKKHAADDIMDDEDLPESMNNLFQE